MKNKVYFAACKMLYILAIQVYKERCLNPLSGTTPVPLSQVDKSNPVVSLAHSGLHKFLTKMMVRWVLNALNCIGGHFTLAQKSGVKIAPTTTHPDTQV